MVPSLLVGKKTILEPMSMRFVTENYLSWLRDPAVTQYMATSNYSMEELKNYVSQRVNNPAVLFWAFMDRDTRKHIGNVKLEPVDHATGCATFGIMLGDKDFWGRGIATEVTHLICDYAFQEVKLKKIDLTVHESNQAAIKIYEKVGFRVEKSIRGGIYMVKNGNPQGSSVYSNNI